MAANCYVWFWPVGSNDRSQPFIFAIIHTNTSATDKVILSGCRTAIKDSLESSSKRHLLRLWLSPQHDRPLPDCYLDLLGGSTQIGDRGGIRIEGYQECVPLEAE